MEPILLYVESFINKLPPMLQLLLGVFITIGTMKIIIMIVNHYEKKNPPE